MPLHLARRLLGLLLVALVTTGLALGVSVTTASPASASVWLAPAPDLTVNPLTHLDEFENRILAKINARRHKAGLRKVRYYSSCIDGFSERWARYLATSGEFKHRNQTRILDRCNLSWVGETLVRGVGTHPHERGPGLDGLPRAPRRDHEAEGQPGRHRRPPRRPGTVRRGAQLRRLAPLTDRHGAPTGVR